MTLRIYTIINISFGVVLALILILPFVVTTFAIDHFELLQCPYTLHGIRCFGCGLTRSVLELYRGNFSDSLALHPGGLAFVSYILFQLALRFVFQKFPTAYWYDLIQSILLWVILSIIFWPI